MHISVLLNKNNEFSKILTQKLKSKHLTVKLPTVRVRQQGNGAAFPAMAEIVLFSTKIGQAVRHFYLKITGGSIFWGKLTAAWS